MRSVILPLALLFILLESVFPGLPSFAADHPQPLSGAFATPLTDAAVDNASFAEWFGGSEHPLANPNLLRQILWTQATMPTSGGFVTYGVSNQPGPRYLRLGFKVPVAVGTVLVRGGDQLSVLRPDAPYPGNLADDSQWIPAQRVFNRAVTTAEVGQGSYALWDLPKVAQVRALRFTHIAAVTDSNYSGVLGGVYLLSGRFANLAPQASVITSANAGAAPLLIDEKNNSWATWDNGPEFLHPVTSASPEWIILSWQHPVQLSGLVALWAGFNAADAEVFTGPSDAPLRGAPDSEWHSIGQPFQLRNQYPLQLGVDWLDFGKTVETRAVRLRLTQPTNESRDPQHLTGRTNNGKRVWLGELMAITPLADGDLKEALLPVAPAAPNPPIPVRFTLPSPSYVSLVIDDAQGNRVRNLVSDTLFPAGPNTVWWDGSDDLGRVPDAAAHGLYLIPTHFVSPGRYQVRGIYHQAIDLRYQFSIYNAGHPAWETPDGTGGWLTNHTPASSALFVPADKAPGGKPLVYLGCWVSEGGSGLAWVDLDGNKQGGRGWIGGAWTAAQFLAGDTGPRANPDIYAYAGAVFGEGLTKTTIRVTGLSGHGDKAILNYTFDLDEKPRDRTASVALWKQELGGLAIHNNVAVVSLTLLKKLLFADATTGKILGEAPVDSPQGLAFDLQGNLLVLSGKHLLRYRLSSDGASLHPEQLAAPQLVVAEGLDSPSGLTVDDNGNIYVSDQGNSNQVKMYSSAGKFLRAIGHPGPSHAGPYDPMHMNNPKGMTVDSNNRLWVTEDDFQPKRVSLWSLDGSLIKTFYGPPEYGGGGSLDPKDKTKFYYHEMEFKLDWKTGSYAITSILDRPDKDSFPFPRFGSPESVEYSDGHRYFDNTYLAYPTNGVSIAVLYLDTGGVIRPVAVLGKANDWDILKTDAFKSKWPANTDPSSRQPKDQILFTWSDINDNGKVDPDEVTFLKADSGSITVMPDLAMIDSYVDGKAMRYEPVKRTPTGVPIYDLRAGQVVVDGAQRNMSDGGGQALYSADGTVLTTAPTPFARDALGGVDRLGHRWSYPSLWPGLHPSHSAPVPDRPGELEGTTRLLGGFVHPTGSDAGPLWAINGNLGEMYLFTADGFYVTQLFQDVRVGKTWSMPQAQVNMLLNDITPHDENFFPSITQTPDGNIYVDDGGRTSIVRVDGLNSIRRLPSSPLVVTQDELDKAQTYLKQTEASRQDRLGPQTLEVGIRSGASQSLPDLMESLKMAQWATIDHRIAQVGWNQKPDLAEAAVTIAGGRLIAAYRTGDPNLLRNSGAVANAPFKTGGALDLMIGSDPHANPKRTTAVAGDERLLVYQVGGKVRALLYRAVVPGTPHPVPFSSPSRTITLDAVEDVSTLVELQALTGDAAGSFVFSIPLEALGLKPVAGQRIRADVGILRGNGTQTVQRVYWSNKATGITSDVPSEAELSPNLWGEWIFKAVP
ncbi:hypothetical protein [Acidicapsa acidisoli]|uniref:hypothetical protein n=1 Tax=Acidicapsa acidisoli TaxID=1615681 RepID=UPI0021DFBE34|nr:hypothetical protein [Acidicapsa acidisoli]